MLCVTWRPLHANNAGFASRLFFVYIIGVRLVFAQAARRHRIGRAHVRAAMANAGPPTHVPASNAEEDDRLLYVGFDDRGVELEIIAIQLDDERLFVIHVMPTHYRRRPR